MKKAFFVISLILIAVILVAGCSIGSNKSYSQNPAATGSFTTGQGTISAKIDGSAWTSVSAVVTAKYTNGALSISGADSSSAIAFAVQASKPGTYKMGKLTDASANAILAKGSSVWQATPLVRGSGTLTITTLTSTGASGTFSFTADAMPDSDAKGTEVVTDGVFTVTFAEPVTLTVPNAAAEPAAISAQIDGVAWSSSATSSASYHNQFLSIFGVDSNGRGITFGLGMVTGPGTYSLAYLNLNGSSAIVTDSSGYGWNTALPPGGTGSITITTLTSTWVAGTFSFDAVPAAGGATGTIHVTYGQFNLKTT